MDVNDLLDQREKQHGDYTTTAAISQQIKALFRGFSGKLAPDQKESLDMIASKVARILAGDADEIDHWRDVGGYAQLVVRRLERKNNR